MREENTERKYPKSKTDGIPKKERKHRRIRAGKKKKYFQAKAIGNRKSFVFQRCAKSCVDLHLEEERVIEGRRKGEGERKTERGNTSMGQTNCTTFLETCSDST